MRLHQEIETLDGRGNKPLDWVDHTEADGACKHLKLLVTSRWTRKPWSFSMISRPRSGWWFRFKSRRDAALPYVITSTQFEQMSFLLFPRSFNKITVSTLSKGRLHSSKMTTAQKEILVSIIGVGLVGSELISQLLSIPSSPFKLVSLTSSKATLLASPSSPITSASTWKSSLATSSQPANLSALTAQLLSWKEERKGAQVVVVDNTSNDDVASRYPEWLGQGFHVATPNKKAFSGDRELFEKIVAASRKTGGKWLNESTVGAGLPVVNTLKEMVASGDKVRLHLSAFEDGDLKSFDRSRRLKVSSRGRCHTSSTNFRLGRQKDQSSQMLLPLLERRVTRYDPPCHTRTFH